MMDLNQAKASKRIAMGLLLTAALGLSACGVKGKLKPPPDAPKEETTISPDGKPGHKPFVLDRLL